jgi:hypothetical protein
MMLLGSWIRVSAPTLTFMKQYKHLRDTGLASPEINEVIAHVLVSTSMSLISIETS